MVGHADMCFGSDHGILQWRFMVGQNLYKLLGMVPGWVWITIGLSVWIGLLTMYVASFLVVFLVQATQEHRIVSPLIAALPFWFRLLQCARRFHDTGPNGAFVREFGMYFYGFRSTSVYVKIVKILWGVFLKSPIDQTTKTPVALQCQVKSVTCWTWGSMLPVWWWSL